MSANKCTLSVASLFAGLTLTPAFALDPILADGFERSCAEVAFVETFPTDGPDWPEGWSELADSADLADVSGGAGRLRPVVSNYSLARMYAPIATRDVEVRFQMVLEDASSQGVGFFVRQNGGHLQLTSEFGQGYAVFVEGTFRGLPGVGVWREENGVEIQIEHSGGAAPSPQSGQPLHVRFRVHQVDPSQTRLQAKIWPVGSTEPVAWQVSALDGQVGLQDRAGGIAVDSWNVAQAGTLSTNTLVDQIEIEPLCNPIRARGPVALVSGGFQFTEGPLWREDHLLFSDISADQILRLDPPAQVSNFRMPSGNANGLALDLQGRLLAAEHGPRRLSLTETGGSVVTLTDRYQGLRYNSPNDLAVASDGTIYFTDPDYGLADPGLREIPFNGLYRRDPDGTVVAEWEGAIGVNQPNGVALSPDQGTIYVTDTQAGELLAWTRAASGALSQPRVLAAGLPIADGICVDVEGNIYVATWGNGIEVYSPDGAHWGTVPIPSQATNCAFGDSDGHTLYVTAQQAVYRLRVPLGGASLVP